MPPQHHVPHIARRMSAYAIDLGLFVAVGAPAVWLAAGEELRSELASLVLLKNVSAQALGLDPAAGSVPLRPMLTALVLLAFCGAWAWYRVRAAGHWGTSIGKHVCGLEVVDAVTLQRGVGTKRAVKRWAPGQALALLPVPGIGTVCYAAALFDPRQRGWHDRAAGTVVIQSKLRA